MAKHQPDQYKEMFKDGQMDPWSMASVGWASPQGVATGLLGIMVALSIFVLSIAGATWIFVQTFK